MHCDDYWPWKSNCDPSIGLHICVSELRVILKEVVPGMGYDRVTKDQRMEYDYFNRETTNQIF